MTSTAQPITDFTEILKQRGFESEKSRLLRHNKEGEEQWYRGRGCFGHFASYQATNPYKN